MQTDTKPCPRCGQPLASADDAEGCRDPLCPAPMIDYGDTERTAEDVVKRLRREMQPVAYIPAVEAMQEAADLIERQAEQIEELEAEIREMLAWSSA